MVVWVSVVCISSADLVYCSMSDLAKKFWKVDLEDLGWILVLPSFEFTAFWEVSVPVLYSLSSLFRKDFFHLISLVPLFFSPISSVLTSPLTFPRVSCLASWICNLPISAVLCKDLCLAVPWEFPCYGIFGITLLVPLLLSITSLGLFLLWMYWSSVRWLSKTQQTWESAEMLLLSACVLCHRGLG